MQKDRIKTGLINDFVVRSIGDTWDIHPALESNGALNDSHTFIWAKSDNYCVDNKQAAAILNMSEEDLLAWLR